MASMRKLFSFVLVSITFSPAGGSATACTGTLKENSSNNTEGVPRNSTANQSNVGAIIPGCTCEWSSITFDTIYWSGTKRTTTIQVTNACKGGMSGVLVECVGWKQEYLPDPTVLEVPFEPETCVFFPTRGGHVLQGGRSQHSFRANRGANSTLPLKLQTQRQVTKYPCYDFSCKGCCVE